MNAMNTINTMTKQNGDSPKEVLKKIVLDGVEYDLIPRTQSAVELEPLICTIDGYQYFLGPEAPYKMTWLEAIEWCQRQSVGTDDEYQLPDRQVLLACFMNKNIREKFGTVYYWSSSEYSFNGAWAQFFVNGNQFNSLKTFYYGVRAVRKVTV